MSSQNAFPGPGNGRPARILNQEQQRQPAWANGPAPANAAPSSQQPNGWPQQAAPAYGAPKQPPFSQWGGQQQAMSGPGSHAPQAAQPADPYAPQFEPYVAPQRQAAGYGQPAQAPNFGHQQPAQWGQRGQDPRGLDIGGYTPPHQPAHAPPQSVHGAAAFHEPRYQEADPGHGDWGHEPSLGIAHDPYHAAQGNADFGFAQPEGGELEPSYEDDAEYEMEDAPRGRRPIMIVAALVGAILVGGGMAYSYKKIALGGGGSQGEPPMIKSEAFPSKTKPADAGGKQFPYADSKIMGRLGDGSSPASAADAGSGSASPSSSSVDDNGTRKVSTLVVGRDGTIQAPPAAAAVAPAPASAPTSDVSVPGTSLVDVFGAAHGQDAAASSPPVSRPPQKLAAADIGDTPAPPKKHVTPVTISKVNSVTPAKTPPATTGSVDDSADAPAAPPVKKKLKKIAKAETTATDAASDAYTPPPVTSSGGGSSGFVAVLASVPKSASSRMDALKRFADMQQKYATALAGKTPDVAEANLGAKGEYHRLIVGPPGSREQANAVCSQLKTDGYANCWVTSY